MLRYALIVASLLGLLGLSTGGCRSCSSCHDYDPPVANCGGGDCGASCGCSACGGSCESCSGPYSNAMPAPVPAPAYVNSAAPTAKQNANQQLQGNQPSSSNAGAQ